MLAPLPKLFALLLADSVEIEALHFQLFFMFFNSFSFPHLFQLLFNFDSVLSSSNYSSLCDLLPVFVIENHPHGVLQILELFWVNVFNAAILYFALLYEREQNVSCQCFNLEVEMLGYLALL